MSRRCVLFVAHSTHSSGQVRKFHKVSCTAVAVVAHSHLESERCREPQCLLQSNAAAMFQALLLSCKCVPGSRLRPIPLGASGMPPVFISAAMAIAFLRATTNSMIAASKSCDCSWDLPDTGALFRDDVPRPSDTPSRNLYNG